MPLVDYVKEYWKAFAVAGVVFLLATNSSYLSKDWGIVPLALAVATFFVAKRYIPE